MSKAETGKRTRNLFDPRSEKPFKLSRSRLERFIECPRCFYFDRRLGVDRPDMPGWSLNSAVDTLLKNEFDQYRSQGEPHPLMREHGINAVPFQHDELDNWRENFKGVQFYDEQRNLIITGAVDDIWCTTDGTLMVVDYKSTSTKDAVTLDSPYKQGYKRQVEIYQWLLRKNGFTVSDVAYFVYANGIKDRPAFDSCLHFTMQLLPYDADAGWVSRCVADAYNCLIADDLPASSRYCKFCLYRHAIGREEAVLEKGLRSV